MKSVSLTTKLAVLFGSATLALISITNLALYHFVEQQWQGYDHRSMELAGDALRLVAGSVRSPHELAGREAEVAAAFRNNGRLSFAILGPSGEVLASSLARPVPPEVLSRAIESSAPVSWQRDADQPYEVMAVEAATGRGTPLRLVLALQVASRLHMSRLLGEALIVITLASGILAALLGYLVSRQGLAPLRRFTDAAHGITASRLGNRMDPAKAPAELQELALGFNAMLERLQDSFRRMEQFSSDLAHELRTPINNLLGQTQVALSRERTPAGYREVLESNVEEYERLSRMIQDMLFIARADEGRAALNLQALELREEVRRVAEYFEPMIEDRGIRFEARGSGVVHADRQLLGRAISNLISNALHHTPENGQVEIEVVPAASGLVTLSVCNQGATIAPGHLPRLFDRFYRVDASRGRSGEGAGLGLAIVKTIAELHGGKVGADSASGWTRFFVELPGTPVPASQP